MAKDFDVILSWCKKYALNKAYWVEVVAPYLRAVYCPRPYHNAAHVVNVVRALDTLKRAGAVIQTDEREQLVFAAVFHDCVYLKSDVMTHSNEEYSARVAEIMMAESGIEFELIQQVAELIRGTDYGKYPIGGPVPKPETAGLRWRTLKLLRDADLAGFAAEPEVYRASCRSLQQEFDLTRSEFRTRRIAFLKKIPEKMYDSPTGVRLWRGMAWNNIMGELAHLQDPSY